MFPTRHNDDRTGEPAVIAGVERIAAEADQQRLDYIEETTDRLLSWLDLIIGEER